MTRRARRVWPIVTIASLLVLAAGAVAVWQYGLQRAANSALDRLVDAHRLGSIRWVNDDTLEVANLTLIERDWQLAIRSARLRFSWRSVLHAPRRFASLEVSSAALRVDTTRPQTPRPIDLPGLLIDRVHIAQLRGWVDNTVFEGRALAGRLQLSGREVSWRAGSGSLQAAGQVFAVDRVALAATLEVPRQLSLTTRWRRIDATGPALGQLALTGPMGDLRGELQVQTPLPVSAIVVVTERAVHAHIARLLLGPTTLSDLRAKVTLGARPFPISVASNVEVPGLGALTVRAGAAWTGTVVPLVAHVHARGQHARLAGSLDPNDWLARLQLTAPRVDAAPWISGADSRLDITGDIVAHVLPPFAARLGLESGGELLGRPLRAAATLLIDETGLRIPSADLTNQDNRAQVRQTSEGFTAHLQFGNLASLARGWRGSVVGTVAWTAGSTAQARVDLRGREVSIAGVQAAALDITGDAALHGAVDLQASARGLGVAGYAIDAAQLTIRGSTQTHSANFALQAPQGSLQGRASGSWRDATWRGRIVDTTLTTRDYGNYRQRAPLEVLGKRDFAQATRFCLDGPSASHVCLDDLRWRPDAATATISARALPLALLPIDTLTTFDVRGVLDVDARYAAGVLAATVTGQGLSARSNRQRVDIETARATVRWPLGATATEVQATLDSTVLGSLELTTTRLPSGALDGRLQATLRDLGFLQVLLADVQGVYLEGRATADLHIGGSLAAPTLDGTGEVRGRVRLPALGTNPLPLRLALSGDSGAVALTGTLGSARLLGNLTLPSLTAPRLQATLIGERMRLIDRPDLQATVSPNLQLDAELHAARVTGQLRIDEALLGFNGDQATNGLSDDVVIHEPSRAAANPSDAEPSPAYDWRVDVGVELGSGVRFAAAGLRTRLRGNLEVSARPRQPLRVLGFVDAVDGTFDTYGVRLAVEQGRLDFDGPADNPRVDARAVRRLDDDGKNLVGVRIRGPLRRMETELFAEPARPAADTLALLITGRTFAAGDAADLAAVGEAGLALGVLDALPLTARLRDSLGLDELEVRGALDRARSQVRVGKQLTRRLRARYVYSVFNRTGGLQLRYQITDQLSLQTEAGAETSAIDVLWEWQQSTPAPTP